MACSICLKDNNNLSETLECGHCYHKTCINESIKYSSRCPICRQSIKKSEHLLKSPIQSFILLIVSTSVLVMIISVVLKFINTDLYTADQNRNSQCVENAKEIAKYNSFEYKSYGIKDDSFIEGFVILFAAIIMVIGMTYISTARNNSHRLWYFFMETYLILYTIIISIAICISVAKVSFKNDMVAINESFIAVVNKELSYFNTIHGIYLNPRISYYVMLCKRTISCFSECKNFLSLYE